MLITDKDTVSRGVTDIGIQDTLKMEMQRGKKYIPTSGRAALFKKMVLEVAFISNSLLNANTEISLYTSGAKLMI